MATSRYRLLLALVVGFFTGYIFPAQAAVDDTPPFFQIEYQGQTAYLLGSIHVGEASFYPMAPLIESKFDLAGSLAVEADAASADIMALIKKYGLASADMDAETQTIVDEYCTDKGQMCAALADFSPWLQSMQLAMSRFESLGYSAQYGVDQVLISKNRGRPLLELESTEFQFSLLASFDKALQMEMIREAIEAPNEEMHGLVDAWRTGDAEHITTLMEGQMSDGKDTQMLEKLLWQRNISMAIKIRELMQSSMTQQPLFIVIGAGHLVGEQSIPLELMQHGAKVKSCWQQTCE